MSRLFILLVFLTGCAYTDINKKPTKFLYDPVGRTPDLYLLDGSPCWYLKQRQAIGRSRLQCDLEKVNNNGDEGIRND